MSEILDMVVDGFFEHWAKVAVGGLFMALGGLLGWWRARRKWMAKEFFERVNFSLNSLHEGKLKIRTLMEKPVESVFLNQLAVSRLLAQATKTTAEDPLIPFAKEDYWFFLNAVLNEISEKFADGFVRRDAGQQVQAHQYVICLTNESDGAIRTRKIRVMLIRQEVLTQLPEAMPELESPNHATRWRTLQQMAKRYQMAPHVFLTVELVL